MDCNPVSQKYVYYCNNAEKSKTRVKDTGLNSKRQSVFLKKHCRNSMSEWCSRLLQHNSIDHKQFLLCFMENSVERLYITPNRRVCRPSSCRSLPPSLVSHNHYRSNLTFTPVTVILISAFKAIRNCTSCPWTLPVSSNKYVLHFTACLTSSCLIFQRKLYRKNFCKLQIL